LVPAQWTLAGFIGSSAKAAAPIALNIPPASVAIIRPFIDMANTPFRGV